MAIRFGDLEVSFERQVATYAGRELALRPMEFRLLAHLATHTDRVQTREALLEQVWDDDTPGGVRTVDVHMARLRRALGEAGQAIVTIRRVGYRLDAQKLVEGIPA